MLTLGYIDVYVEDIMGNWEDNVRQKFEKQNRTKEDDEYIKKQAETDWYVKYQIKKRTDKT